MKSAQAVLSTSPVWLDSVVDPLEPCQDYPGPSVWNSSRLAATSIQEMSTGDSPFWEIVFTNASGSLLPVQTVNRTAFAIGPIDPSSPCGKSLALYSSESLAEGPPTFDTPSAAAAAWSSAGDEFASANRDQLITTLTWGDSTLFQVSGGQDGWSIEYSVCGLPGVVGLQPFALAYVTQPGGQVGAGVTGTLTCSLSNYSAVLGGVSELSGPDSSSVWKSTLSIMSGTLSDAWGLQTWPTTLTLTNASGSDQPPAVLSCAGVQFGLSSCLPVSSGWFVALASSSGGWLDVYGNLSGGVPSWALPNVPIYSNDSMIIVLSPSLEIGRPVTLTLGSSSPILAISGALVI